MKLQVIREKLKELNKAINDLKEPKLKVIKMPMTVQGVFRGDVWYYPPNKKLGVTVSKVNKKENRVEFTDDGWNPYDDMIKGKWVLVSRQFNKSSGKA